MLHLERRVQILSRSVLTDVILTDGFILDAFWTVNERPKSAQKAKASSVPVDLRERFSDAVPSTLLRRCPADAFSGLFMLLDLSATLSPRMSGGTQNVSAEFTSKTGIRDRPLRPLGKQTRIGRTSKKRTSVNITSVKTQPK